MDTKTNKIIVLGNRFGIKNITDLKTIIGKFENDYIVLLGKDSRGDGDAREYYWDSTSTVKDNSDTIIQPNGQIGAGRWLKVEKPGSSTIPVPRQTKIEFTFSTVETEVEIANPFDKINFISQFVESIIINSEASISPVDVNIFIGTTNIYIKSTAPFKQGISYFLLLHEIL